MSVTAVFIDGAYLEKTLLYDHGKARIDFGRLVDVGRNSRQSTQAPIGQRVGHTLRDACITWCVVPAQRLVGRTAPTRSPVLSGPRPLARAVHRRALFEGFAGLPSERRAHLVLWSLYAGHSVVGSNES